MTARRSLVEIAVLVGLFALLAGLYPVETAVRGGAGEKLFVAGRVAALVLLATWLLRRSGEGWAEAGLRRPAGWRLLAAGVAGGLLASALATAAVAQGLLPVLGLDRTEISQFLRLKGHPGEYLFWLTVMSWGAAAFGEEMIFRGFVLHRLAGLFGGRTGAAIVLQAAMFGALHFPQGAGGALIAGAVGVVLGLAWLATGRNLWAPILIHGLLDATSMTAFYLGAPTAPG